ncbi:MAG: S1 RNA-binding domain-containing protein [Desulfobacteraceae bacterium]|nr:S1 RNA-binding domain-containing protein [Desulfobacteraceae bacterium]
MTVKKIDRRDIRDMNDEHKADEEQGFTEDSEEGGADMASLMAMYEESFNPVEPGRIVEGEVAGIERDRVLLDIGDKYEGEVPLKEFAEMDGSTDLSVGDRVEVYFSGRDEEGFPLLSRQEVRTEKLLEKIGEIYETEGTVRGRIVSQIKGGFFVDIGIRAFLPASQLDIKPAKDPGEWIDTEHEFKVLQFDKAERNVVISRRVLIEHERRKRQEDALRRLNVGDVAEGVITNITDYGLFVELEGITGLVHVSNIAWTPLRQHPSKIYSVGDQVSVKVLEIDAENRKVSLGIKQLTPNPWDTLEQQYPRGAVIEGKVKKVTDFGIFVGIVEGINGLVHASDISWTHTVKPSEHYRKGQTVQAKILDMDRENQRVNLGIKQLYANPWEELPHKYPQGAQVAGRIVSIADFGLFVEIEEGIQGLVHVSELPAAKGENPLEKYEVGQEVQARVLEVLAGEKKIRLSMKEDKADHQKSAAAAKGGKAGDPSQAGQENNTSETALGRLLKEKMEDREQNGAEDEE